MNTEKTRRAIPVIIEAQETSPTLINKVGKVSSRSQLQAKLREKALLTVVRKRAKARLARYRNLYLTTGDVRAAQAARRVMAHIDTSPKAIKSVLRKAFQVECD